MKLHPLLFSQQSFTENVNREITIHKDNNNRKSASVLVTREQMHHLYVFSAPFNFAYPPPLLCRIKHFKQSHNFQCKPVQFHQHMLSNSGLPVIQRFCRYYRQQYPLKKNRKICHKFGSENVKILLTKASAITGPSEVLSSVPHHHHRHHVPEWLGVFPVP